MYPPLQPSSSSYIGENQNCFKILCFVKMGLLKRLEWVNTYGKMRCRSLFWRVRAALKRAFKNGGKQRLKFQYDPSSYALNFDDGCCAAKKFIGDARLMELTDIHNNTLIYVLWVKTN